MNRSRSRSAPVVTGTHTRYKNGTFQNERSNVVSSVEETIDDVVTPNFRERSAAGEIINNPCLYTKAETRQIGSGSYHSVHTSTGNTGDIYGDGSLTHYYSVDQPYFFNRTYPDTSPDSNLVDEAKLVCLRNIDSTPYSFAEDLFELRQTWRFLRNPIGSLTKLSKSFSKEVSKLSARRKYLTRAAAISQVWLEYRFAFSPLVRSVGSLIEAQQESIHRPKRRTARNTQNYYKSLNEFHSRKSGAHEVFSTWGATTSLEVKAGVLYDVSNPLEDWKFKYGLRVKDIPKTLWDVFPYSFMIDRVSDISNSIAGVTNLLDPSVHILAAWVTRKELQEKRLTFSNQVSSGYTHSIVPDTVISSEFTYERSVWVPSLNDIKPGFSLGGLVEDSTKLADLTSLIIQRLR